MSAGRAGRAALVAEQVGQVFVAGRRGRDRLEYTELGSGEAWVVLLPGLLDGRGSLDRAARVLAAAGLHVLVLDPLGHGGSDRPADPLSYSVPAFAAQTVALLDAVGAERALLVGSSWGANIALEVAVAAPERVAGLVLDGPVLDNALAAQLAVLAPVLYAARFAPLALGAASLVSRAAAGLGVGGAVGRVARASSGGAAPVAAVVHGVLFGRVAPSAEERAAIVVPTLVLARRRDPLHPASDADLLAGEVDGAVVERAVVAGEWRRRPERIDLLVTRFALEQLRPDRGRRPRRTRSS